MQLNESSFEVNIHFLCIDVDEHVTKQVVLFAMATWKIWKHILIISAANIAGDMLNWYSLL